MDIHLFTVFVATNGSTQQFLLAEKMARHGATDDHIMGIIGEQVPVTQLSLEEQQIQESLIRLDNRLNNIQVILTWLSRLDQLVLLPTKRTNTHSSQMTSSPTIFPYHFLRDHIAVDGKNERKMAKINSRDNRDDIKSMAPSNAELNFYFLK